MTGIMFDRITKAEDAAYQDRKKHIHAMGFVKPLPHIVAKIIEHSPNGVLEIGAGTGALARAISDAGCQVIATDNHSWEFPAYARTKERPRWIGQHYSVLKMGAERAAKHLLGKRTLLCSWPDFRTAYCVRALRFVPVGGIFIYIGEGEGGCTGTPGLFKLLRRDFVEIDGTSVRPWLGLNDYLDVYRRER